MNRDTIAGDWKTAKGKLREKWGELTDDDLDSIAGKRDQLIGAIQKRYGKAKDAVEKEVADYETANENADAALHHREG
jgi:uncharacterized protein YjbJ (UPF0337 family)